MDKATAVQATKLLKTLFSAFPTASRSDELLAARTYLEALEGYGMDALERSVNQFIRGDVPTHDGRFAPSAAELSRNVRQWDDAIKSLAAARNAPPLASGLLKVDFGHGPIDMTKLSVAEQDVVLRTGRAPAVTLGPATVRLQRMGEKARGFTVGDADGDRDVA